MFKDSRWLVGIDFSEGEEEIITYVDKLSRVFSPEKIYFVHIEENLEIPEEILQTFPEVKEPLDETLKSNLEKQIENNFTNDQVKVESLVDEGPPLKQLLHTIHTKKIDLFIVRKKNKSRGSGVVPQKVARKASCSILFVPENQKPEFNNIFIPCDFSEHSQLSLKTAIRIKEFNPQARINLVNIYDVPVGYYKTGKSFEEFSGIMKGHAQKAYNRFLKNLNIKEDQVKCDFVCRDHHDVSKLILEEADKLKPDIMIMGSKGATASFHFLLGSVTEKVITKDLEKPFLIVKIKNENLGFIQALLRI